MRSRRVTVQTDPGEAAESETIGNASRNGDFMGAAAPVAGTWAVGNRVWNSAPAAAQPMGWICTVAGTPGTWRAMPNLT